MAAAEAVVGSPPADAPQTETDREKEKKKRLQKTMSFHAALAAAEAVVSAASPRHHHSKAKSSMGVLSESKSFTMQPSAEDETERETRPTLHPPLMSDDGENAWTRLEESLKAHKGLLDNVEASQSFRAGGGGTEKEEEADKKLQEERKEPPQDKEEE